MACDTKYRGKKKTRNINPNEGPRWEHKDGTVVVHRRDFGSTRDLVQKTGVSTMVTYIYDPQTTRYSVWLRRYHTRGPAGASLVWNTNSRQPRGRSLFEPAKARDALVKPVLSTTSFGMNAGPAAMEKQVGRGNAACTQSCRVPAIAAAIYLL